MLTRPPQFEAMSEGQSPEAVFITCSDSRLIPSRITQTGPGELFVIRNAGNIVPPYGAGVGGAIASIEYAVAVLETPTVIVCGHTLCGAMKAALEPDGLDTVPHVRDWIRFAEPARLTVDELRPNLDPAARWRALVERNVIPVDRKPEDSPLGRGPHGRGTPATARLGVPSGDQPRAWSAIKARHAARNSQPVTQRRHAVRRIPQASSSRQGRRAFSARTAGAAARG